MEQFSEEHSKSLLDKEWLVKTDNQLSTPYLFKFYSSTVDLSCCILLTDTKSVWTEVLTSNQFARRWRDCNQASAPLLVGEEAWRITTLKLVSGVHTLGGIADISFTVVKSNYADFAFELECDTFKWRWETCFLGHKPSAEIISKHLIFPLISVNHLAFSSIDAIGEMPDMDVEKAVDKMGRTARRTIDTHIKNAISKPRVASTLRRMTAVVNFIPDLPPVISIAEKPELRIEAPASRNMEQSESPVMTRSIPPQPHVTSKIVPREAKESKGLSLHVNSATESEGDDFVFPDKDPTLANHTVTSTPLTSKLEITTHDNILRRFSPLPSTSGGQDPDSDSTSSPTRPSKKTKKPIKSSGDDDSEEERKRYVAQAKSGAGSGGGRRGIKQPVKRGGKRF